MPQSAAYRAHFALSYSGIKKLKISPLHWWAWYHSTEERKQSRDMFLGTLVHLLLLEPHREKDEIAVWDQGDKRGKKWDFFEAQNIHKMIVKPKELAQARAMVAGILTNPFVNSALSKPGKAELEYFGTDRTYGCPVKCTFDWITDDFVLDLKKTSETIRDFERWSIKRYNYHVQLAFYLRLAELMDGKPRKGGWVVVEDFEPHATVLILPNDQQIEEGRAIVEESLHTFATAIAEKRWNGYDAYMKIAEVF